MNSTIPRIEEVQATLRGLGHAQMHKLAELSDMPFTTLWKIRAGVTENPGIETVRKFMPFVRAAAAS